MASFYIELKELRKSKEISLDQIHQRTKINMRYLEAIEAGNFDILPIPYLRLFLRAYAKEIGGDANIKFFGLCFPTSIAFFSAQ